MKYTMTCQWSWIHFLWIVLPLTFAILVWMRLSQQKEAFLSTNDIQTIIETYKHILNRSPTSTELAKHIKDIDRKEYTIADLEIRLYNSDEYKRLIKTQDNGLSPELSRMVEEKELIQYIRDLYTKERRQKPKTDTLLPLKDLFIYFDYNPYKFVAMLRDSKYPDFEEEFLTTKKLSKEGLMEIYKRYFDDFQITRDADAIRKIETITSLGKKFKSTKRTDTDESNIFGLTDTDKSELVNFLIEKGFSRLQTQPTTMNADGSYYQSSYTAKPISNTSTSSGSCVNTRYYLTPEDTIKSKETGFDVGKHPPVCVPVGIKHPVSPVVFGDLLGATLDEAKDTSVGSIMPKFEYKEYIEIPNSCSADKSKGTSTKNEVSTKKQTSAPSSSTTWQKVPRNPSSPQPVSSTKQYSDEIQKYDSILKPALEAFAKWKNEMNTNAFYTEIASSKDAKAFFKKYPYMVDILALYVYEKSAERASLNQVAVIEYYTDIGYYTNSAYRYGSENTHFSIYMTLSYFNQFYTNNRAIIDECIKLNTCLTGTTTTPPPITPSTPRQYSTEALKYKAILEAANKALRDNLNTITTFAFYEEMGLNKEPITFFKKYPYMIDIMKLYLYEKSEERTSISSTEVNDLYNEIGYYSTSKFSYIPKEGVEGTKINTHISVYLMLLQQFYLNNRRVIDDCIKNNTCLTSSTPVEGFSNGQWYSFSKFI